MDNILYIVLGLLFAVDVVTTHFALETGKGQEKNPVIIFLMGKIGQLPALIVTKVIISMALIYLHANDTVLSIMIGIYGLIAINNIRVLLGKHDSDINRTG